MKIWKMQSLKFLKDRMKNNLPEEKGLPLLNKKKNREHG